MQLRNFKFTCLERQIDYLLGINYFCYTIICFFLVQCTKYMVTEKENHNKLRTQI